jgi:hypothetical protein
MTILGFVYDGSNRIREAFNWSINERGKYMEAYYWRKRKGIKYHFQVIEEMFYEMVRMETFS